jgi:hypothetical protein
MNEIEYEAVAGNALIHAIFRVGVELSQVCAHRNWGRSRPATVRHAIPNVPDLSEGGGRTL